MPLRFVRLVFCALAVFGGPAAQAEGAKLFPAEAAIPNSRVIRFMSAIDKEPYTIQISVPFTPPPKTGYPVMYVLDGELYFPQAAIFSHFVNPGAVIVGIGHEALHDKDVIARYARKKPDAGKPLDGAAAMSAFSAMRAYDLTQTVSPAHRAPDSLAKAIGPETGNVDAFLQVIEKEIKPKVEAMLPIDHGNQALFGHSYGGLAAVRALFIEPNAFRTFILASPSIWHGGGDVLGGEKNFADAVTAGHAAPRVLITVGSLEPENLAPGKAYMDRLTPEERASSYWKMMRTWPGMITGAHGLATRLQALHGKPGYRVDYQFIADQDHVSSAYVAITRALPFAFADTAPRK